MNNRFHIKTLTFMVLLAFLAAPCQAQKKKGGDYYTTQYKKQNRNVVTQIAQGQAEEALQYSDEYLSENPQDLEAVYIRALALSSLGRLDEAMKAVEQSLKAGVPLDRYLAGPRNILAPLYNYPAFQKLANKQGVKLIHGPLLGSVTHKGARVWVRTVSESSVAMAVSKSKDMAKAQRSAAVKTKKNDDFTAVAKISGLQPDTEYFYQVEIDGRVVALDSKPSFRTFPAPGAKGKFEVGFGGGAGFTPWFEHMWTTILSEKPLAFLLLGDNVYIDTPEVRETQRYCYYRRQSRPEYRAFSASTPVFAIWDDHDFGDNDCTSSLSLDDPPWKLDVLEVFKQNWANPYYGGGKKRPGVWFDTAIGDVDFFFLDCRFYRQNPKSVEKPSMIGPDQKKWLLGKLKRSRATFKVIASSVPWSEGTKGSSKDTWDGFPDEREDIFSFIEDNKVEGVILIAADRHRSDAWKTERENGYPLYEFMSSKLTNVVSHGLQDGALFGYNEKCSYGRLAFDTAKPDPTATYIITNIDGDVIHTLTLKKSELSFQN